MFDGKSHIPLMTLPVMRDRTMRIGSAGKSFPLTGWKVGHIAAGATLTPLETAHQNPAFATALNSQRAIGAGPGRTTPPPPLSGNPQARRDQMVAGLTEAGST